ncbi:thiamine pyrophosphate-binding protein [Billgrantia bachuensis]|uniref:Thiamine pyrophosphate-binding protein n=1 Tax=Billgrantia bachuensis TaxID=2717286 RepID=A0ABX0PV33_9GAMM|nr:thiamine pyrophosphate-binding protein [Halomonas bachuensis]NIC05304.1 thiamine pyrophosphate-binding protein [Halomonas bachuensis]
MAGSHEEQVPRTGAQVLVDALLNNGVTQAFAVPGESYLSVLDALYDHRERLKLATCRHESGASNMAEAYAKMTGLPGICFVTRGPGACHASIGVHTAHQDSTPMILFIGQVARHMREREAFQEIDYRQMFGPVAKWVTEVDDARRLPELLARAFQTAISGRPGPVVVSLPEDMLDDMVRVEDAPAASRIPIAPDPQSLVRVSEALEEAQRPVLIVGGGDWSARAGEHLRQFAEAHQVPILASFRCQDFVDNDSPAYVGRLGLGASAQANALVERADLVIALGARLGEATTQGYTLLASPRPRQRFIHVHADIGELGRVYHGLSINATSPEFAEALATLSPRGEMARRAYLAQARQAFEAYAKVEPGEGELDMQTVVATIADALPKDTIHANGAGNYTLWLQRYLTFHTFRSQLAPTSGAMGYGFPAAIGAKLAHPERSVVAYGGDGCALMSIQELATAHMLGLKILFVVVNNGSYGTIRMHQERRFPGRISGTELANPDFAALARGFGLHGEAIERNDQLPEALARCQAHAGSALLEIRMPTDTPYATPPKA